MVRETSCAGTECALDLYRCNHWIAQPDLTNLRVWHLAVKDDCNGRPLMFCISEEAYIAAEIFKAAGGGATELAGMFCTLVPIVRLQLCV